MIARDRAQLTAAIHEVVDGLVELIVAGIVEGVRAELGVIRGAAPTPSGLATRTGHQPAPRPTDLLTIGEVATLLNVPKATVSFWTYRVKILPHISLGSGSRRLCRIKRSAVNEFVERGLTSRPADVRSSTRQASSRASSVLTRRCEGCGEGRSLAFFERLDDTRCRACLRRTALEAAPPVVDLLEAKRTRERSES